MSTSTQPEPLNFTLVIHYFETTDLSAPTARALITGVDSRSVADTLRTLAHFTLEDKGLVSGNHFCEQVFTFNCPYEQLPPRFHQQYDFVCKSADDLTNTPSLG